jgi:branched-chain amino acid transport system substrate-binding protein
MLMVVCGMLVLSGVLLFSLPAGQAAEKKVVKIAWFGPLTGADSFQGIGPKNCFDLAIRQANESGKFPYKVEGMILDDASETAQATSAATKATADPDVIGGTGFWVGQCAFAATPIFHNAKKPLILWGVPEKKLISGTGYKEIFRVCPTTQRENEALAKVIINKLGYRNFCSVSDTTEWGKETHATFKALLEKAGGKILSLDRFAWGTKNFRPILSKVVSKNPEGIYFGGIITEAIILRKQMSDMGVKKLLASNSGITEQAFNDAVGAKAAEGVTATSPGVQPGPNWEKFVEAYKKAGYKEDWGVYGPFCYQATQILLAALEKVGPDSKALIDELHKTNYTGVVGLTKFDPEGEAIESKVDVVVSQDGKWLIWENSEYASGKRTLPKKGK